MHICTSYNLTRRFIICQIYQVHYFIFPQNYIINAVWALKVWIIQTLLEHSLSALIQLHLHYRRNTWLQWIRQRQLRGETIIFFKFGDWCDLYQGLYGSMKTYGRLERHHIGSSFHLPGISWLSHPVQNSSYATMPMFKIMEHSVQDSMKHVTIIKTGSSFFHDLQGLSS